MDSEKMFRSMFPQTDLKCRKGTGWCQRGLRGVRQKKVKGVAQNIKILLAVFCSYPLQYLKENLA